MEIESKQNSQFKNFQNNKRNIPIAELRIIKDLTDYMNKKEKKINISNIKYGNEEDYIIFVEFLNLFKIQIKFLKNYPFEPPIITYISGKYYEYLFDMENKIKLDFLIEGKWSPVYDLNYIINFIEKKINIKYIPIKIIRKRNYFEYIKMNGGNIYEKDNYFQKKIKIY